MFSFPVLSSVVWPFQTCALILLQDTWSVLLALWDSELRGVVLGRDTTDTRVLATTHDVEAVATGRTIQLAQDVFLRVGIATIIIYMDPSKISATCTRSKLPSKLTVSRKNFEMAIPLGVSSRMGQRVSGMTVVLLRSCCWFALCALRPGRLYECIPIAIASVGIV